MRGGDVKIFSELKFIFYKIVCSSHKTAETFSEDWEYSAQVLWTTITVLFCTSEA